MRSRAAFLACVLLAALLLAGCDSAQKSTTALETEITAYTAAPNAEKAGKIRELFARLDGQIIKLSAAGHREEADAFQRQRDALQLRFTAAQVAGNLQNVKKAAENLGQAFRQAGEAFGEAFKDKPPAD